ncbi:hypothetical protein D6C83_08736 [Aureobasidium pullulans]|uniref:RING-type domain-containing protein n=1 Tax=Aureobasidium pullulans TaxID=5580 RepID=A0A4S9ZFV5_AURPU|nr:hypothetical protein D6C83_08736 [Aureobasidium pullulans]
MSTSTPQAPMAHHSLIPRANMNSFYQPENVGLTGLIIRLQREDIGEVARDDEALSFALELQLQELSIVETDIADHQFANKWLWQLDCDYKLALALSNLHHEADAALLTCTGCDSRFTRHQSFKAPCDRHFFCFECLANFFEYTIGDEPLYPPKCCDIEISLDNVRKLLDDRIVDAEEVDRLLDARFDDLLLDTDLVDLLLVVKLVGLLLGTRLLEIKLLGDRLGDRLLAEKLEVFEDDLVTPSFCTELTDVLSDFVKVDVFAVTVTIDVLVTSRRGVTIATAVALDLIVVLQALEIAAFFMLLTIAGVAHVETVALSTSSLG